VLFSSPEFFAFFIVYSVLHVATPSGYRSYLIIAGSTIFYGWWNPAYVWIPYALMVVAYAGVGLIRATEPPQRAWRQAAVIALLFVPLLVFKYANFLYQSVLGPVFGWHGEVIGFGLPLGLSFLTFTLTAYVVDSTNGRYDARPRPANVLAYVLFFPHLIAGPILRPSELIPQLERGAARPVERYAAPATLFTVGLVKKLVFADQIGVSVDAAYALQAPDVASAWLAIYGFAIQIYCDFSGYSDMAIGLALLLGVKLPANFLHPYTAASPAEFWRRWHITLSKWLRDYLYIPLGGNRHGALKAARNVMVTMTVGGLWHGANWTFVIWGLLHGCGIVVARYAGWARLAVPRWLAVFITFHFVTLGWVFFRAPSLTAAGEMLRAAFLGTGPAADVSMQAFPILLIVLGLGIHQFDDQRRMRWLARRLPGQVLWPVLGVLVLLAIAISGGNSGNFIYFDF